MPDTIRHRLVGLGAVVVAAAAATTMTAAPAGAAPHKGGCDGYSSESKPPPTIEVLVGGDRVTKVAFSDYVKDVLPNEWVPSWGTASLRSGAMAAKTFAWYWVNHSKHASHGGHCYDVTDTTSYQVYKPGHRTHATDAAVDDTWDTVAHEGGAIFVAHFQRSLTGDSHEPCGTLNSRYPDTLSQIGSESCAKRGWDYKKILSTYYHGVSLSDGTPPTTKPTTAPPTTKPPTGKPTGKPTKSPTGRPTGQPSSGGPTSSTSPSHTPPPASSPASGAGGGSGRLPVTGTSLGIIAGAGAAVLAAGAVLLLLARRRRVRG